MKKKRSLFIGLIGIILLGLIGGCGTNKNLEPVSELVFKGADPPSVNVGVDPPNTRLIYFVFDIKLNDPGLSLVASDAWTIDRVQTDYTLISDPGHHLVAVPSSDDQKVKVKVKPYVGSRIPVTLVSDGYLQANASGFAGTTDSARLAMHVVFKAHRNKDGYPQTVKSTYYFSIGNY